MYAIQLDNIMHEIYQKIIIKHMHINKKNNSEINIHDNINNNNIHSYWSNKTNLYGGVPVNELQNRNTSARETQLHIELVVVLCSSIQSIDHST